MRTHILNTKLKLILTLGLASLLGSPAVAQMAAPAPRLDPNKVSLDQKLDQQAPLDTPFTDETGKSVRFGAYFGKKPVILNLIFYKCPGVCMMELDGMTTLFKDPQMTLNVGDDFEVVTVSINPKETPEMAASKKKEYLELLGKPQSAAGWHFLTGTRESIDKLASAVGFRYAYDAKSDQYAHPAGIMVLTPAGKLSKYFYKTTYPGKDVRLSLVEASNNKIGSLSDKIFLNCIYQYDPTTGKYGFAIIKALRIGGVLTLLVLVSSIVVMSIRSGRNPQVTAASPTQDQSANKA
jgi:protein SCO1/2